MFSFLDLGNYRSPRCLHSITHITLCAGRWRSSPCGRAQTWDRWTFCGCQSRRAVRAAGPLRVGDPAPVPKSGSHPQTGLYERVFVWWWDEAFSSLVNSPLCGKLPLVSGIRTSLPVPPQLFVSYASHSLDIFEAMTKAESSVDPLCIPALGVTALSVGLLNTYAPQYANQARMSHLRGVMHSLHDTKAIDRGAIQICCIFSFNGERRWDFMMKSVCSVCCWVYVLPSSRRALSSWAPSVCGPFRRHSSSAVT